ncbi:hypothetical protein CEXT_715781 [Caerostris extrusa]|uniref:Uncharacterized protein n=1 Tax=Caerostris extrusa TaxID=172846 RepID=A0AAV4N6Q7_CAEEX|nr:hypothetical protein CEXT_715781 [Caerostris extrusa]
MGWGAIKTLSIIQPAESKGGGFNAARTLACRKPKSVWLKARMRSSQVRQALLDVNDTKQRRRNVNLILPPFRSLLTDE